ncbi:MAG TPA: hypothetical protein VLB29_04030 [Nocardioidaceae bacterium]|nr:hypothetical protein [Nocardioidaceae bacterium]
MTRVALAPFRVAHQPEAAGHFWVYVQYLDALRRLGCDVWWLEEMFPKADPSADSARVAELVRRLRPYGLTAEKVVVYRRPADGAGEEPMYINVTPAHAERVFQESDLVLNFHYALTESMLARFPRTVLVDIDPGLLQLWWANGQLKVNQHDLYFSIGENLGAVPGDGREWIHTSPAVSLDLWPFRYDAACPAYTSISSWHSSTYVLVDGELFDANKKHTYLDYIDLPRRTGRRLELATTMSEREEDARQTMLRHGWTLREAHAVAGDPRSYQAYIQQSRGELGLAKPAYTMLRNAWFSDRTACYLASGKPAVVQDTGPSAYLPDGLGLIRFSCIEEAVSALAEVDAHYERHCRAAREIAESHFSATDVVRRMLNRALAV